MISWLAKTIGQTVREVVEVVDTTLEEIKNIPDSISKGYDEGIINRDVSKDTKEVKSDSEQPAQ
jgi:hypothetical protein